MILTQATYDTTPATFADGVQPPASPQWNAAEVQIAYTPVPKGKGKTKTTGGVILLLLLGAAVAFGQTDNTLYVKQFAGATVGAKLTNAMQLCNGNTAIPCILVLDPSLAVYPSGTMPTLCAQCSLLDYRGGVANAAVVANVLAYAGATAAAKINACLAAIGAGVCDARGLAGSQVIDATVTIGAGGLTQKLILSPTTLFAPSVSSPPAAMFKVMANGQIAGLHVVLPAAPTYTGKVLDVEDTITVGNAFSIDSILIDGSAQSTPGGYGLYMQPPTGGYIQLVNLSDVTVLFMGTNMYLGAAGASGETYINGVNFANFVLWGNTVDLAINPQTAQYTEINGNTFSNLQLEGSGIELLMEGAGPIQGNVFSGVYFWDSTTPVSSTNHTTCKLTNPGATGACVNLFWGGASYSVTAAMDPFSVPDTSGAAVGFDSNVYNLNNDNAGTVFGPSAFSFAMLNPSASNGAAFIAGWPGANYWGCGPISASADYTIRCGTASNTGVWTGANPASWWINGAYENSNGAVIPATATGWQGNAAGKVTLAISGTTGSIGGGALTAGTCASGTATIAGGTAGHAAIASESDGSFIGGAYSVRAVTTSATVVTVQVCALIAGTPAAKTYNVLTF